MDNRRKTNRKFDVMKLAPAVLIVVVLLITVGYSAFSDNLMVGNIQALVQAQSDIRITNLTLNNVANGGVTSYNSYGPTRVVSNIDLPNSDSTVTYNIEITNIGNVEMGVRNIIGLPSNLEYTLTGYTLGATLCDSNNSSECKLGSVTTFQLTIGYGENGYDSSDTQYNLTLNFDFYEVQYVAMIGSEYYLSLVDAVADVPSNNTETRIVLLKNTSERVAIGLGKNVLLDFPNLVVSNKDNAPVFEIQGGTLKMINGTISTSADQGAINVETPPKGSQGGTFIMTGGRIISTGNRQALYVNVGSATISGSASLSASAQVASNNQRGTVQTLVNGTLTITGGTIESTGAGGIAVSNAGSTTIGIKDCNVSTVVPLIKGIGNGIYISKGTFNYYDGRIAGGVKAINDETKVTDLEVDYDITHSMAEIGSDTYDVAILGRGIDITFDPGDGTVDEPKRTIIEGSEVGTLPIPRLTDYIFDGWYTDPTDGEKVLPTRTETTDTTYYAHWTYINDVYIARIGSKNYHTLAAAISAAPGNTETTIELLRDTIEKVTIAANKNIILDCQSYVLSNPDSNAVITVSGRLKLIGGTISTNSASTSAINVNNSAHFTMTGGSIVATGKRQAVYNDGGTVTISGTAHLSAKALVEASNKRGTVQNLAGGTLIITGGTIETASSDGIGVTNLGTMTIGEKDTNIVTTTPVIVGASIGVNNTGTFNFYDGILKGKTSAANASPSDIEDNAAVINGTELIGDSTYNTMYLESTN